MKLRLIITFLAFTLTACGQQSNSPQLARLKNYTTSIIETALEDELTSTDILDIKWSSVNSNESPVINGFVSPQEAVNRNNNLDALRVDITKTDGQTVSYTYRLVDHLKMVQGENFQLLAPMEIMEEGYYLNSEAIKILRIDRFTQNEVSGTIQTVQGPLAISLVNALRSSQQPVVLQMTEVAERPGVISLIGQKEATFLLEFEESQLDPGNAHHKLSYAGTELFREIRDDGTPVIRTVEDNFPIQLPLPNSNSSIFRNR